MVGTLDRLPAQAVRKVGTTSSHHGPYAQGNTRATMGGTAGCEPVTVSQSQKTVLSSDRSLQLDSVKAESLVIAHQLWRGEYVPGPCTHRPSSHGSWEDLKVVALRRDLGLNQRLGLSRNKVAVPEGVAGTPPFWSVLFVATFGTFACFYFTIAKVPGCFDISWYVRRTITYSIVLFIINLLGYCEGASLWGVVLIWAVVLVSSTLNLADKR